MTTGRSKPEGWARLMRRLLPAWFRHGWNDEIVAALRMEEEAARRRGTLALILWRVRAAADLSRAGWQARRARPAAWRRDLQFAVRSLLRSPALVLASTTTLGLGTAVSAGMFSAVDQVVVRPLPVTRPHELVRINTLLPPEPERYGLSGPDLSALVERADLLESVAWHVPARLDIDVVLGTTNGPERVSGLRVSPGFFRVHGVTPVAGAGFTAHGEDALEVMLSHSTWLSRYGGAEDVVGRALEIDRLPHTVVGVLPATFDMPFEGERPAFWIRRPLLPAEREFADSAYFEVTARLRHADATDAATAQIVAIERENASARPAGMSNRRLSVTALADVIRGEWRRPLTLLGLAALLVLLMACGSVALLLLARQATRERELALWMALGATRSAIARRLLLEAALLSGLGLVAGLVLASQATPLLLALVPNGLPRFEGIRFDWPMWTFAAVALAGTTMLAGLAPMARLRQLNPSETLRAAPQAAAGATSAIRSGIVALECGLMAVLLVALGLVLTSFTRLSGVDPGFDSRDRLAFEVTAPRAAEFPPPPGHFQRQVQFFTDLRERLLARPGVVGAGVVSNLPLTRGWGGALWVRNEASSSPDEAPVLDWEVAGPGYFEAAGIPIRRGREFEAGDVAGGPNVVIVNEELVRRHFPDRDPMGLEITGESPDGPWRRVVGIVGDVRQEGLQVAPRPHMYIAQGQSFPFDKYQMVVATAAGTNLTTADVRATVREVDPEGVTGAVAPLRDLVVASVSATRLALALSGIFAGLAALLAVTGTWGVISLAGRARRHEWAVRSALGAGRGQIITSAARAGMMPVAIGLGSGFVIAAVGARWLAGQMYGIAPLEPSVLAVVLAALGIVAGIVVVLPANRASRVDPARVLRDS